MSKTFPVFLTDSHSTSLAAISHMILTGFSNIFYW